MAIKGGMIDRSLLSQESLELGSEMRFASSAVTALCKELKAPLPTRAARDKDFGFNWFHDAYPNFPVFMDAAATDFDLLQFWHNPHASKVWDVYGKLANEYRRETFGLLTAGPGLGKIVVHNAWGLNPMPGYSRLERRHKSDKTKGLVVENIAGFAASILQVWSP